MTRHAVLVHKNVFRDCVKHVAILSGTEHSHFHDNAKSHTVAAVTDLLRHWQRDILEHPPYSPDMSPCDYDLLAKMKEPL